MSLHPVGYQAFCIGESANFHSLLRIFAMFWLKVILGLYGLWASSTLYRLYTNYLSDRKTGLPMFFLPVNHYNPVYMILSVPLFRPLAEKILPEWMYEPIDLSTYGWEFRRGYSFFEKIWSGNHSCNRWRK